MDFDSRGVHTLWHTRLIKKGEPVLKRPRLPRYRVRQGGSTPSGFSVARLAQFATMLITEFSQAASERGGKALEVSRNHVQMGSRHALDLEGAR